MPVDVTTYAIDREAASMLAGASVLPADIRRMILGKWADEHGRDALVALFAEFIGLANRVAENCRSMAEEHLVAAGAVHPDRSPGINMPTVFGALMGVRLADGIDPRGTCPGCAFRLGSDANQSPATTADAELCVAEGERFMCHMEFDDKGDPTRECAGYRKARAERLARGEG